VQNGLRLGQIFGLAWQAPFLRRVISDSILQVHFASEIFSTVVFFVCTGLSNIDRSREAVMPSNLIKNLVEQQSHFLPTKLHQTTLLEVT